MAEKDPSAGEAARLAAHAIGNVFLGLAMGLTVYYFATDMLTRFQQQSLAAEFPVQEAVAAPTTPTAPPPVDDPFDWDDWETEDLAYWEGRKQGQSLGRLTSEAMDLDAVIVKGTSRSDLMKGPGWILYSDLPGPEGNFGVAGHRTTYGAPFRDIDKLEEGDTITFTSPYRIYTYEVLEVFSVTPDRVDVMASTEDPMLTMSACHPPYSARLRLIAQSQLVSVERIED